MTGHAKLVALDREARALAQSRFDRPLLVEAGAGTGKTSTLVARVLGWSLGPGWEAGRIEAVDRTGFDEPQPETVASFVLDGITAITFTEAAAAEMAGRVAGGLAKLARGMDDAVSGFDPSLVLGTDRPERTRRARALLGVLDRLETRTIHAFCRTLLARYPLEGGLHPDLTVDADDRLLEEVVREVVESAIRVAYAETEDSPLLELALRRIGPDRVAAALTRVAKDGLDAAALEAEPYTSERVAGMISDLLGPAESLLRFFGDGFDGTRSTTSRAAVEALGETRDLLARLPAEPFEAARELCTGLGEIWSEKPEGRLKAWGKEDFTSTERKVLGEHLEEATATLRRLAPRLLSWAQGDPELLLHARRALAPLAAEVREKMRSRGAVTFNDLLREARDLLVAHRGVAARERRRIRQLLVDEFQDTDRTQCDLVRVLGLEGQPDERPGLFVVGDPKQSIYGWRDADLEAYSRFQRELEDAGGERLTLYRNFRSAPVLLDEVERAVKPVMQEVANLQPAFAELVASEVTADETGFANGGWAPVEHWISWREGDPEGKSAGPKTPADEAAAIEARAIAADVHTLHHEAGVGFGEFGILLRSASKVETFLAALREAGVPFKVAKDKSYYRRREIIDAAALVRTILNPTDHLALVTFLRSPVVGVPDAALLPLWTRDFPDLVTRLGSEVGEIAFADLREAVTDAAKAVSDDIPGIERMRQWPTSLNAALEGLATLRRSFRADAPDRFLEKLRRVFLPEPGEAARFLGAYRLANLERFFHDLASAMEDRGGDVESILRALRRAVRESEDADEATPGGAAGNAVHVMTIHAAKGLQFGHVYLPQLHAQGGPTDRGKDEIDTRRDRDETPEYRLFGAATPGFFRVEERQQRIERAERVRTLYVALTRAEKRLVLLGKWPTRPAPSRWDSAKSHLALLESRRTLPENLADLALDLEEGGSWSDAGEARWKLARSVAPHPDDAESRSRERRADAFDSRVELPGIEAELASGAARRERARRRMSRPWSVTASDASAERLEAIFGAAESGATAVERAVAQAVGVAFHRVLERWNLQADPDAELARSREELLGLVGQAPGQDGTAAALAAELMDRFAGGTLWRRFLEIAPEILGREVPVLLTPPDDRPPGPVGFLSGVVDLVYRDPRTGVTVVADYKTDRVEPGPELAERAEAYVPQERLYAMAIQGALGLSEPPRTELWFVWPDALHREETLWNNGDHHETSERDD